MTESRRAAPALLRILMTTNLIGASVATYVHISVRMPASEYSKMLYPNPCRVVYGIGPGAGSGVGDQNRPDSSSRM